MLDDGMEWWQMHVSTQNVQLNVLTDSLLQSSAVKPPIMSNNEIAVFLRVALEMKETLTSTDWHQFLTRFGPFEECIINTVQCFQFEGGIAPWFYGSFSRANAVQVLKDKLDGAFLVRFSETQPEKFTLTYVKIYSEPPFTGKKIIKNVLIVHVPGVNIMLHLELIQVSWRILTLFYISRRDTC